MRVTASIDHQQFVLKDGPKNNQGHTIKTLKDMLTVVTPASVDVFLQDLKHIFILHFNNPDLPIDQFEWVDDNKNNLNINYKCEGTNEEKTELLQYMKSFNEEL